MLSDPRRKDEDAPRWGIRDSLGWFMPSLQDGGVSFVILSPDLIRGYFLPLPLGACDQD